MVEKSTFRTSLPFLLRIVVALLAVALVPLLFASWRLISVNRDSMELQVKTTQTIATRTAADAISTFVETRKALARSIAASPVLETADGTAIGALLQSSLQAWGNLEIEGLALLDAAGTMLLGTRIAGSDLELSAWVSAVPLDQEGATSALEVSDNRILLVVREPLARSGSVMLVSDTNGLRQPLEPSQLIDDSGALIAVFDHDGRQLAGSLGDLVAPEGLMNQALAGAVEGSGIYRTEGEVAYIGAFSGIEGTDWTVIAMQPRAVAERVAERMRARALSALAIALGIVGLLVFATYGWLVKPLRNLLDAQRRLAMSRGDEGGGLINQLQRSFQDLEQRMADQHDLGEVFLGRYQVLELVGRGGMGTVFRGWDPQLERYLALKTVRFDRLAAGKTDLVGALLKEAKTTARIQHPHVVQVFDVASVGNAAFVAMEFVDGISLEGWVQRGLPPARLAIPVTLGIAEGMGAAHEHEILHRDIKAANVLLGFDGSIKVTDFGLAKFVHAQALEADDLVFGTPGHIAPEVLLGEGVDKPADVFALGVVLHYLLTGYTPFRGQSVKDTLKKTLVGKVGRPSHLRPEIPKELENLLFDMLGSDPQARPTAGAIVQRLRDMQSRRGIEWYPPPRGEGEESLSAMPSSELAETQPVS